MFDINETAKIFAKISVQLFESIQSTISFSPLSSDLRLINFDVLDYLVSLHAKSLKEIIMSNKTAMLESILDLNSNNIWILDENELAKLWEKSKAEEDFTISEDKLLNVIRLAFEVVHYDPSNSREMGKYENGEWAIMSHCRPGKPSIAIRKKVIKRLTDLSYENVKHITAATLLDLIDQNFGGGWDSISLAIKDIIETGFDISTTQLPASRIHMAGGTLERKVAQGFEVLEIPKGSWVEAIFAKKKDPVVKLRFQDQRYDKDGNLLKNPVSDEEEDLPEEVEEEVEEDDEDTITEEEQNDDTFYSSYSPEAEVKEEDEEGFPIEE